MLDDQNYKEALIEMSHPPTHCDDFQHDRPLHSRAHIGASNISQALLLHTNQIGNCPA